MARTQEEDQTILDYVPQETVLMPHVSSLLVHWVQILFDNWLDEQWADRDPSPQFSKLWLQLNLKEAWEPTFPHGYSSDPPGPQPLFALSDLHLTITRD